MSYPSQRMVLQLLKINVFNTKTKKYYSTFITAEAYNAVRGWIDFRSSFGELITGESWIIRDLWQIKSQRFGNYLGLAKNPKQLSSAGIRMLINDAWKIQGVRELKKTVGKDMNSKVFTGLGSFSKQNVKK